MELLTVSHSATTDSLKNVISAFHVDNMELVAEREEQLDQLGKLKRQVSSCTCTSHLFVALVCPSLVLSFQFFSHLLFSNLLSSSPYNYFLTMMIQLFRFAYSISNRQHLRIN